MVLIDENLAYTGDKEREESRALTDTLVIAGIVIGACIAVYVLTSVLIAFGFACPNRHKPRRTPADFGAKYEYVTFPSAVDNIELHAWYIPGGGKASVIIMPGGKAHRADESMGLLELCVDLAKKGYNVLTLDRRGCGHSEIPPFKDRAHMERDFEGAVQYIRRRSSPNEEIFLFGNSVAALAAFVYTHNNGIDGIRGIIADSAFETKMGISKRILNGGMPGAGILAYGALYAGEKLFGMTHLDSLNIVGDIKVPILYIIGDRDRQIPVEASYQLLKASGNPESEIVVVPGAAHSRTYRTDPKSYLKKVVAFLERNNGSQPATRTNNTIESG